MAFVPADALAAAAQQLALTGRYDDARRLLASSAPAGDLEDLTLAVAAAHISVEQDFAQRTSIGAQALDRLDKVLETTEFAPESAALRTVAQWDAAMTRFRMDYGTALYGGGTEDASELANRIANLRSTAPDDARAGLAAFYAGLTADNLQGESEPAFAAYTEALDLGERSGDDLVVSYALRHLGDHAHTAGDLVLARTQWERSTELRQKVGHLLGALAQQVLLAVLLHDEGNPTGATTLATEINRWSRQAGFPFITDHTAELMTK